MSVVWRSRGWLCVCVCVRPFQKEHNHAVWILRLIWYDCISTHCANHCVWRSESTLFLSCQHMFFDGGQSSAGRTEGWMRRERRKDSGGGREDLDSFPVAEINNILFSSVLDIFPYFCYQSCSQKSRNVYRAELSGHDRPYKEAYVSTLL